MNTESQPSPSPAPCRRSFIKCAAAASAGLAATTTLRGNPEADRVEEAVNDAIKKEQAKAFQGRIEHEARYLKPLIEAFGEEGLEIIKKTTIEDAREHFEKRELERRDLQAVKELLWDGLDEEEFDVEKLEDSATALEYRVNRCIYADTWRAQDAGEIGFAMACCWDYGFCQGLNPNITFTRAKTLMQGDCCCNHRYELEA